MAGNFNFINFDTKISLNPFAWFNRMRFTKKTLRILFIDDKEMPTVTNLKKDGWAVEKVRDITNVDSDKIKRNHIIFVDYKGVGKNISPQHEGIGLAGQIKDSYGKKKRIILYTSNSSFSRESIMSSQMDKIDNKILKNADFTEFRELIINEMKKIR